VIAKFGFSSLLSALLDLSLFTLFMAWPENITSGALLTATILARVLSGALNYFLNRKWVFSSNGSALKQAVKYLALFCALMLISWKSVDAVYALTGWHVTAVKLPVDSVLFFLSFFIQHKFIFPAGPKK
ncbi:MAG: GtrA family protein, partial [Gracilibacteraceae bacterium]|nr:GtrA family protein [Gracilibacteraceae bacterium]